MKDYIFEFFKIPTDFSILEFAKRLKLFLVYMLEIAVITAFERAQINAMIECLSEIRSASVPRRSRTDLHNHLKSSPFFATLMLLDEPSADIYSDTEINRQYAFLVHMYCVRGVHDYLPFLVFYRCFIERVEPLLTLSKLLDLTTRELQQHLVKASVRCSYLSEILPFFLKSEHASVKSELKRIVHDNYHQVKIDDELTYIETSDVADEENSRRLLVDSKVTLTTEQQRRKFKRKIAGAQRAFYNYEAAVAFGIHAAVPREIEEFLKFCAPALLDSSSLNLSHEQAGFMLVFFLRMFGLQAPLQLELRNNLAKDLNNAVKANSLCYALQKDSRFVSAYLELRADQLKTLAPTDTDPRLHFIAVENFSIQLPANILEMLNLVLRQLDSSCRHNVTLGNALNLDEVQYRKLMLEKLKGTQLRIRGINLAALERSFQQFSRISLPRTYTAFLNQSSSVQSHYISAPIYDICTRILLSWRDFCNASNIRWLHANADETAKKKVLQNVHSEVGSKITLRDEFFLALYPTLLKSASINDIALYIYMRIATVSGLRPVLEPFPKYEHMDLSAGWMTVGDKRVHAKDERRLVVLTASACRLLCAWRLAATKLAHTLLVAQPACGLMFFENKEWCHFTSTYVNEQLALRTNQRVINHSFRHVAARKLINLSDDFDQRLLDFLMNHSNAGVGLLDNYSSLSPLEAASLLRQRLEKHDQEYQALDAQALVLLESLA
jgi:hypothetical protein